MENKNLQERATALFKEGYNCAQSVFAAYSEELGIPLETALKLSSSFGGGMGRLREVCGAVSGMFMVLGMKRGYSDPNDKKAKKELYRQVQALAGQFEKENGSIICRELLGLDHRRDVPVPEERTDNYYKKRPCVEMVRCAAKILDQYLSENELNRCGSPITLERQVEKYENSNSIRRK
jgi:C_GCAxxG_C_C family probable redox protein